MQTVELFIAITSLIIGASHVLRPNDWAVAFRQLHGLGRSGAFINGALSLVIGAVVVAGHNVWTWPGAVLTGFGWLLVAKGALCFLLPDQALKSMEHGCKTPRSFTIGGCMLLAIGGWAGYCLYQSRAIN